MFVRFRETPERLHVSLVETSRCNGRVKHEHVGSFGSISKPLTVDGRLAFWKAVHERLGKLANRVNDPGRILGQIHARIPMVILDEQHALKIEHAEGHERFWTTIRDGHQDSIEGYRQLIAHAEHEIAVSQAEKTKADEQRVRANETVERLRKGENVAVAKPLTREEMLRISGMTEKQAQHCEVVHAIHELGADKEYIDALVVEPMGKSNRRIARAVLRKAQIARE